MFATPVIYPLSMVNDKLRLLLNLNPLTSLFELFRYGFLGQGTFSVSGVCYSVGAMMALVVVGSMLFNKFSSKIQDVL